MKKILLVDDSPSVRQQARLTLTEAGYFVVEATDGLDGLYKLTGTIGVELIIADIIMPRMNGLDMIEQVKSDVRNHALPILMLTSEGQPAPIERAERSGVKAWVTKPFKSDHLLAAVKRLLPS